jgi:catechol 2,3-dioxygenase-like lactoylglutathione lyase family enzyme
MPTVNVRYIVDDVDAAVAFYTTQLGFELVMHPAPTFAAVSLGGVRLYLNAPGRGANTPDGRA